MLNKKNQMDIVLSNHMPGMEKMRESLEKSNLFSKVYFFDDKLYQEYVADEHLNDYIEFPKILISWPQKMRRYYRFHKMAAKVQLPQELDFKSYDRIYAIDGVSTINLRMNFEHIHYIVSEHAKNNFQISIPLHKLAVRISILLDRLNIIVAYSGCSKYVSAIEVSEDKNLVSYLKGKKIIEYNVEEMVQTLTADMKNDIFELYASSYGMVLDTDKNVNVLLTAPILEDGLVDNFQKVERCWRTLVETYGDKEALLLIKAHPRDKTDYGKIFSGAIIADPLITAEVLAFATKLNINKVLNLYSSTVTAFTGRCECVTVGRGYIDKVC